MGNANNSNGCIRHWLGAPGALWCLVRTPLVNVNNATAHAPCFFPCALALEPFTHSLVPSHFLRALFPRRSRGPGNCRFTMFLDGGADLRNGGQLAGKIDEIRRERSNDGSKKERERMLIVTGRLLSSIPRNRSSFSDPISFRVHSNNQLTSRAL